MILAAGEGTRLRPLTLHTPKPLLEIGGVALLEHVARRCIAAGADRLVINAHHLAERIERFVADRAGFGVEAIVLREPGPSPLGTGGAVLHAAPHLRRDAPFLLHNGDVLSEVDLGALLRRHQETSPLATLAVREAGPSRYLLFDDAGLCGLSHRDDGREELRRVPSGTLRRWDFAGIHVVAPRFLDAIEERGAFSIVWPYLRLAAAGERILPAPIGDAAWADIGTPEALAEARRRADPHGAGGGA